MLAWHQLQACQLAAAVASLLSPLFGATHLLRNLRLAPRPCQQPPLPLSHHSCQTPRWRQHFRRKWGARRHTPRRWLAAGSHQEEDCKGGHRLITPRWLKHIRIFLAQGVYGISDTGKRGGKISFLLDRIKNFKNYLSHLGIKYLRRTS